MWEFTLATTTLSPCLLSMYALTLFWLASQNHQSTRKESEAKIGEGDINRLDWVEKLGETVAQRKT